MKKKIFSLLGVLFFIETIYFNIVFDFALLGLLLMTALSLGSYFKVKVFGIDKVLVSLAIGLGVLGCLLWLSTFYNFNYKSLYLIFSIFVMYVRKEVLYKYILNLFKFTKTIYSSNPFLLSIIIISFMFYIIAASAPIHQYDALTKHIAIPFKILNSTHWDYNIIESVYFGDYAILSHMFYLYLLALGGIKSLVIFNTTLSFLLLITILRIASILYKDKIYLILISLLYVSMPLIYSQSTILYVDMIPLYFVFTGYLIVQYSSLRNIRLNIFYIGLISGIAMFSKQMALFYIIPMIAYILYLVFIYRKRLILKDSFTLIKAIFVALIPFVPPILIIWYKTGNPLFPFMNGSFKSEYFPTSDFVDPFQKSILGVDFHSLYSIVFETSKNVEMVPLGAGVYVLLAPIIFFGLFIKKKRKKFLLLFLVTLGSYWLSTKFSYNIRYFLGSLILLIPTFLYILLLLCEKIKYGKYLVTFGIISAFIVQSSIVFHSGNYLGFKRALLTPDENLIRLENSFILNNIPNKEKQFILSNNDPFRGTFTGHYYVLNWFNSYLLGILKTGQLTPANFLKQFDYYLIDKRLALSMYTRKLDPENNDIKTLLEIYSQTDSHVLYKIKKEMSLLKEEVFDEAIVVKVDTPQIRVIQNNSKSYKIILDVEKIGKERAMGRYQINWSDKHGGFIGTSLLPFEVKDGRHIYTSNIIQNIPKNAYSGVFYLTAHDKIPIKIYAYKIFSIPNGKFLMEKLNTYGEKFPYLAKYKIKPE
jgi:hypothetical protein